MAKDIFITLDQFKALAARIQAKNDWLLSRVQNVLSMNQGNVPLVECCRALIKDIQTPCDGFLSDMEMRCPLQHQPTQMELFGEEFC